MLDWCMPGMIQIVEANLDPGDVTAPEGSYQHSLFLRRQREEEAAAQGVVVKWKYDLFEGMMAGVMEELS